MSPAETLSVGGWLGTHEWAVATRVRTSETRGRVASRAKEGGGNDRAQRGGWMEGWARRDEAVQGAGQAHGDGRDPGAEDEGRAHTRHELARRPQQTLQWFILPPRLHADINELRTLSCR